MSSMDMGPTKEPEFPENVLTAAREIMTNTPRANDREGAYEQLLKQHALTGGYSSVESCSVNLRPLATAIGDTEFLGMLNTDFDFSTGNF